MNWFMEQSIDYAQQKSYLDDLFKASQDCTAIIHAAALSTVWGKWEDFYNVNVLGTKNVVQVCEEKKLKLVFVILNQIVFNSDNPVAEF